MIHEAFGLDDQIGGMPTGSPGAGYLTLAVDLFSDGGARRCLVAPCGPCAAGAGPGLYGHRLPRGPGSRSPLSTGKTGVIGFCMGGGFALLAANDGFDAASVNYGRLPRDLELRSRGACPIVANYGAKDRTLRGAAAKLDAALDASASNTTSRSSPTAGHSFLNDTGGRPAVLRPLFAGDGRRPGPGVRPGSMAPDRGPLRPAPEGLSPSARADGDGGHPRKGSARRRRRRTGS